jgi:hypothetical protein
MAPSSLYDGVMDNLLSRLLSILEVYQITDIPPTFGTHGRLADFAEFPPRIALGKHKFDIG